jgi:hypothetical protein
MRKFNLLLTLFAMGTAAALAGLLAFARGIDLTTTCIIFGAGLYCGYSVWPLLESMWRQTR